MLRVDLITSDEVLGLFSVLSNTLMGKRKKGGLRLVFQRCLQN